MDEEDIDVEYTNCESRGQSLYFIPDSYTGNSEYMVARNTGLFNGANSDYESMSDERSSVKTFVNKFEERLHVHKSQPLQFQPNYKQAEVHYANIPYTLPANIPHTLPTWKSRESILDHRKGSWNEAESDTVYYTNDVRIRSLNGHFESAIPHTANAAKSLIGKHAKNSGDQGESCYELQENERQEHIKLLDNDSRAESAGEMECLYSNSKARIVSQMKETKLHEVAAHDKSFSTIDSKIRSCEGDGLIGGCIVVRNALNVAKTMLTYLNEISDREDISLNESDISNIIGVANTLKCHIREVEYHKGTSSFAEAYAGEERLGKGQLPQQHASPNYAPKEEQYTHFLDDYEEQFDQIAKELKASGKQALARRGNMDDMEEKHGRISVGSSFSPRSKIIFILIFVIISVAWVIIIYIIIHKKYITIK